MSCLGVHRRSPVGPLNGLGHFRAAAVTIPGNSFVLHFVTDGSVTKVSVGRARQLNAQKNDAHLDVCFATPLLPFHAMPCEQWGYRLTVSASVPSYRRVQQPHWIRMLRNS